MRSGSLRESIDIEATTDSVDSWGDVTQSWAAYASGVPASIQPIKMTEFQRSAETQTELTHKIVIRYSTGVSAVSAKHRVKYGSRYFDINSVVNAYERGRMIELMCVERG